MPGPEIISKLDGKNFSALIPRDTPAPTSEETGKIYQKGVRFNQEQNERCEIMKIAVGETKDAPALEKCFEELWKINGKEYEEKAKRIKEIMEK